MPENDSKDRRPTGQYVLVRYFLHQLDLVSIWVFAAFLVYDLVLSPTDLTSMFGAAAIVCSDS